MGCSTDIDYCLGTGKNYQYLLELNNHMSFFRKIIPLEHSRYIININPGIKKNIFRNIFCN